MDMFEWLGEIGDCLSFDSPVTFYMGFSFFAKDDENSLVYIYAVRQLASFTFKFKSKDQFKEFIKPFSGLPPSFFLQKTFIHTKEMNPFYKSGFRPVELVCNYIWIRK